MELVGRKSILWNYLSVEIRDLIADGEVLLELAEELPSKNVISDYSYLVFPFSKGYEGFLKKLFLDLGMIKEDEYYGDDIRIGRILNPSYIHELKSVYKKLSGGKDSREDVASEMWEMWRKGRNQVFHYFPHNFRKLSYDEALAIIKRLVGVMEIAVARCKLTIS